MELKDSEVSPQKTQVELLKEINELCKDPNGNFNSGQFIKNVVELKKIGVKEGSIQHQFLEVVSKRNTVWSYMTKELHQRRKDDLSNKGFGHEYLKKEVKNLLEIAKYLHMNQVTEDQEDTKKKMAEYIQLLDKVYNSESKKPSISRRKIIRGLIASGTVTAGLGAWLGQKFAEKTAPKIAPLVSENRAKPLDPKLLTPTSPQKIDTQNESPRPSERSPILNSKPNAYGEIAQGVGVPLIYDGQTGNPLPYSEVDRISKSLQIGVIGYGINHPDTFRCFDPLSNKHVEIPINQLIIKEGSPVKEVPKLSYLGIRNDELSLMKDLTDLGVSKVRIVCNNDNPTTEQKIQSCIKEATRLGLNVLCTYNPSKMPDVSHIRQHMQEMLRVPNITIELGNEPDETTNGYWEDYGKTGGSFESFAKFVKTSIDIARSIKPDVKIIIGASSKPENRLHPNTPNNQERLVAELKKQGVDISKVKFAVHAYHESEIRERIPIVQNATGQRDLVMTELGHDSEAQDTLPNFIKQSKDLGISDVYIHEFPKHENNWGLIDPRNHQKSPRYFFIQKMVIDETKSKMVKNVN